MNVEIYDNRDNFLFFSACGPVALTEEGNLSLCFYMRVCPSTLWRSVCTRLCPPDPNQPHTQPTKLPPTHQHSTITAPQDGDDDESRERAEFRLSMAGKDRQEIVGPPFRCVRWMGIWVLGVCIDICTCTTPTPYQTESNHHPSTTIPTPSTPHQSPRKP